MNETFNECYITRVKKRYESESVYGGWSQKVFCDHPPCMYGLGRPFEIIENLILIHKLIQYRRVSDSTL